MDKLPDSLNIEQKRRKIRYLVNDCLNGKEKILENKGTNRNPIWSLRKKEQPENGR